MYMSDKKQSARRTSKYWSTNITESNWNSDNGSFTFVAELNNFLSGLDERGNKERNIIPSEIKFVNNNVNIGVKNLQELLNLNINGKYINYSIFVNAKGVTGNVGLMDTYLAGLQVVGNDNMFKVVIAKSEDEKPFLLGVGNDRVLSGEVVNACNFATGKYDYDCWTQLYDGSELLKKIKTENVQIGKPFGTEGYFFSTGGWSNINVSMLMFVTVNIVNYCTEPNSDNISNNFCYPLMANYFTNVSSGLDINTEEYINKYCSNKFSDDLLKLKKDGKINDRDLNICACNMPEESYYSYDELIDPTNKIPTRQSKCFIGSCLNSNFKPMELRQCPPASCINIASLGSTNVTGNLTVEQQSNCIKARLLDEYDETKYDIPDKNNNTLIYFGFGAGILIILITIILLITYSSGSD